MITIKKSKRIRIATIISVLLLALVSCNAVGSSPIVTSSPTITSSPTFTQTSTLRPSLTSTPTYTSTIELTATPTLIPETFGTPVPAYKNVPIPKDAVVGMDDGNEYQFISAQSPFAICEYFIDVLPPNGWEIQQITIMGGNLENANSIWLAVSSNHEGLVGVINIYKPGNEEFTYVHLSFANPD